MIPKWYNLLEGSNFPITPSMHFLDIKRALSIDAGFSKNSLQYQNLLAQVRTLWCKWNKTHICQGLSFFSKFKVHQSAARYR